MNGRSVGFARRTTFCIVVVGLIPFVAELQAQDVLPGAAAKNFSTAGATIDVGALIKAERDVKYGGWLFRNGVIESLDGEISILELPVKVPAEYVLEVDVMRTEGTAYFAAALVVGDRQCYVDFDGPTSGIGLLDGKSAKSNPLTVHDFRLDANRPTTLRMIIRKSGVTTSAGNRTIVDWRGDLTHLKLPPGWTGPVAAVDKLYLKANAGFAMSGVRLTPIKSN